MRRQSLRDNVQATGGAEAVRCEREEVETVETNLVIGETNIDILVAQRRLDRLRIVKLEWR